MSRRRRNAIFCACFLFAAGLILLDRNRFKHRSLPTNVLPEKQRSLDLEKYHGRVFFVIKVVDGDTLDIDIPDGKYGHTRIRLWGIDTPETKKPGSPVMYFGPEASNFATKLALNKRVRVFVDETKDTRDKFGRLLAYIQLPDDRFLNEVLISEGFAYADLRFDHSLYYKYISLESAARSIKRGLWKEVTRDQIPTWLQKEKPKLLLKK